ncbi:hypothetical protein PIB30_070085 [Stylosanthes scabra]|uniref:Uncharacterized protein n=1 Tax=Stylosanthes scabra TaxID=79078 RepID=A0ABU6ZM68_9FABA|nr:hypothetical protein [Stylosanthes scabra]
MGIITVSLAKLEVNVIKFLKVSWSTILTSIRSFKQDFDLAEAYVMRKMYNEKMKNRTQEERQEKNTTKTKIHTTKRVVPKEENSVGCFSSWLFKKQHKKKSRISDYSS